MLQAASEVDSMQKELTQAKVVVEAATQDCNALLEVITVSTADVETKQAVAIAKEEELKVSASVLHAPLQAKGRSPFKHTYRAIGTTYKAIQRAQPLFCDAHG